MLWLCLNLGLCHPGALILQAIGTWVAALGAKKPTPGGGAAGAVAAAIGAASGAMAAIYTTRKKDEESGVAGRRRRRCLCGLGFCSCRRFCSVRWLLSDYATMAAQRVV